MHWLRLLLVGLGLALLCAKPGLALIVLIVVAGWYITKGWK